MHPFIPVGMVEVPMSVDEVLDWIGTNLTESVADFWPGAGKTSVDQKLTVATGKNGNIPTCSHENAYVATEFLNRDRTGRGCFPCCLDQPFILSE
jgi:hypothetical protein